MTLSRELSALPLWMLSLLVIVLPTLAAASLPALMRRLFGFEWLEANTPVAGIKFALVGGVFAVLLGFAVIVVWQKFDEAETAVTQEAAAVASLYRLTDGLDAAARGAVHEKATKYARTVIADDWPAMAEGRVGRRASAAPTELYGAVLAIDLAAPRNALVAGQMLGELRYVTQGRRQRLALASGIVPGVVWLVLLGGVLVTLVFTCLFGARSLRAQMLMTAMLALLVFMALFVIVSINHPFTGPVQVVPDPIRFVLRELGGVDP